MSGEEFRETVDRIKKINGRRYVPRDKDNFWSVPASEQGHLKSLFKGEIVWEEETMEKDLVPKSISTDTTYLDELLLMPYPFQALGINFLIDGKKCLLADEMGLGKTIQILGAIYKLYRAGEVKQALIICPSSLKYQWAEEIEKFLDIKKYNIKYRVVDGLPKQRVAIYDEIQAQGDILYTIINYELVLNDVDYLLEIDWDAIGTDESHRIKNRKSKTFQAVMKLDAPYKWGSTGTPMQNKPDELFNIMQFINPDILGNWFKFRNTHIIIGEKFRQPNMILGYKKLDYLHQKISPYMIRRLKKDVAPELPDIIYSNVYVEMYPEQYKLHESVREELFELIKEVSKSTVRNENGEIIKQHPKADSSLGMFTILQEICDAPELLKMSDSNMAKRYAIEKCKSPKLDELEIILTDFLLNNPDGKAVVFTQFARMQELIVKRMSKLGECEIVNGSMKAADKQRHVVNFKFSKNIPFIICTDAANYGINLQEASLLVNFDFPWNPAVYSQRNARIHRLNSEHESVNIINLIAKDGLDERIIEAVYDKQSMSDTIVETREKEKQHLNKLTTNLMSKLLKKKKR